LERDLTGGAIHADTLAGLEPAAFLGLRLGKPRPTICLTMLPWFGEIGRLTPNMVPSTALVLPLFLMLNKVGLVNTIWGVILQASNSGGV
jgi:hypothetical protein